MSAKTARAARFRVPPHPPKTPLSPMAPQPPTLVDIGAWQSVDRQQTIMFCEIIVSRGSHVVARSVEIKRDEYYERGAEYMQNVVDGAVIAAKKALLFG